MEKSKEVKVKDYEEENNKTENKEIIFDDGTEPREPAFEKALVKEGEHTGTWTNFTWKTMKKYKSNEETDKLIATITLETGEEIPRYMPLRVSKGTKGISNSALWDYLENHKLIDKWKENPDHTNNGMIEFLNEHVLDTKNRVIIKTVNKGQGKEKEYSRISEVLEDQ